MESIRTYPKLPEIEICWQMLKRNGYLYCSDLGCGCQGCGDTNSKKTEVLPKFGNASEPGSAKQFGTPIFLRRQEHQYIGKAPTGLNAIGALLMTIYYSYKVPESSSGRKALPHLSLQIPPSTWMQYQTGQEP